MKIFSSLLCALSLILLSGCLEKKSEESELTPNFDISEAYSFATMPGANTGAAFMVIENTGDVDDILIGAKSRIAKITEIHQNIIDPDDSTMMMRKIKNLDLPAGEKIILEPKGYHLMFIELKKPLTLDAKIPVTLFFEKSGMKKINVKVMPPGMPSDHNHNHNH